jgi:hypothetical protein
VVAMHDAPVDPPDAGAGHRQQKPPTQETDPPRSAGSARFEQLGTRGRHVGLMHAFNLFSEAILPFAGKKVGSATSAQSPSQNDDDLHHRATKKRLF